MVLTALAEHERSRKHQAKAKPLTSIITSIREDQRAVIRADLLHSAQGWELEGELHVLEVVQSTTLRPDRIMWSSKGKEFILVRLTVLWKEGCLGL